MDFGGLLVCCLAARKEKLFFAIGLSVPITSRYKYRMTRLSIQFLKANNTRPFAFDAITIHDLQAKEIWCSGTLQLSCMGRTNRKRMGRWRKSGTGQVAHQAGLFPVSLA